jgi:hypothetical protein
MFTKGARPIELLQINQHYTQHSFVKYSLKEYTELWRHWLTTSNDKILKGLESFVYGDYTQGTSHTFDHFVLRHSQQREIVNFVGDFQYHACISKKLKFRTVSNCNELSGSHALILSIPFSDFGIMHPDTESILLRCNYLGIPVCIDLAYWGIARNICLDLNKYPCITEVTSSLSKSFYTLENHRVGIRFSRQYLDDGISMLNEVQMQNFFSMSLGAHYMKTFSADWNWKHNESNYLKICQNFELTPTDTIIFGLSSLDKYAYLNRGNVASHRVCVSSLLKENIDDC